MFRSVVIVGVALAALVSSSARAQDDDPSASEVSLARDLFRQGIEAAREERWEEARDAFQRSFDLAPRPLTLLNLAGAQVQTGRLVEGAEMYRRFLREVRRGRPARQRPAAQAALDAVEARIAYLRIEVEGISEGDAVTIDGEEIPLAALQVDFPVNPGTREIGITRDGETIVHRQVELGEAERRELRLEAPPRPPGTTRPGGETPGESSILSSPWLWVGVGAAVVAAVVLVIVLSSGGTEDPYSGNVPPGTWVIE